MFSTPHLTQQIPQTQGNIAVLSKTSLRNHNHKSGVSAERKKGGRREGEPRRVAALVDH